MDTTVHVANSLHSLSDFGSEEADCDKPSIFLYDAQISSFLSWLVDQFSSPDDVRVVELLESPEQGNLSNRRQRKSVLIGLHSHTLQSHKLSAVFIPGFINRPVSATTDLCHRFILHYALLRHDLHKTNPSVISVSQGYVCKEHNFIMMLDHLVLNDYLE